MFLAFLAMVVVVVTSNIAVQFPFKPFQLEEFFTWGAWVYPFSFLVTDLTNRHFGPKRARHVVYAGFVAAVILSAIVAPLRIALASLCAFLLAQLTDVTVFHRLRHLTWWIPPLTSSSLSALLDTSLFFIIAFAGTGLPIASYGLPVWVGWALGDLGVKLGMAVLLLGPYAFLRRWGSAQKEPRAAQS